MTGSSSDRPVLANGKPSKLISDNALQKEQAARRLHMTFEAGVEIITIVIAWRGKVVFLNLMLTLSQSCVVIVMQIKLTVIVGE